MTIFDLLLNMEENLGRFPSSHSLLISMVFLHKALGIFAKIQHFLNMKIVFHLDYCNLHSLTEEFGIVLLHWIYTK